MASLDTAVIDIAYVLTVASYIIIIITRILFRRLKHEKLLPDDYVMVFSMVLLGFNAAVSPIAIHNGTNSTVANLDKLRPEDAERVALGSKWVLIGRPFYLSYLWLIKGCMLIHYARIATSPRELWAIYGTAAILGLTWLTSIFTIFLECSPLQLYWTVQTSLPECAKASATIAVIGVSDIFTNLLIMAIAIPMIIRARPLLKTIVGLVLVYFIGILAIGFSILRIAVVILGDLDWAKTVLTWVQIECFLTTLAVNGPILHSLWHHGCGHIRKGRFGLSSCDSRYTTPVNGSNDESSRDPETQRSSVRMSDFGNNIRASFIKLQERAHRSHEAVEIERTVELLQESKTGKISSSHIDDDPAMDLFRGMHGGPVAHISTQVSHGTSKGDLSEYSKRHQVC